MNNRSGPLSKLLRFLYQLYVHNFLSWFSTEPEQLFISLYKSAPWLLYNKATESNTVKQEVLCTLILSLIKLVFPVERIAYWHRILRTFLVHDNSTFYYQTDGDIFCDARTIDLTGKVAYDT